MHLNRRDWLKLGLLATAAGGALRLPLAGAASTQAPKRPLRILILGGTGFTGPHQVRYAVERGHEVTLFNRGRRAQDWPQGVEERALHGKIGHYLFISTISVYADGKGPGMDERAPLVSYTGKDAYKETLETFKADMRLYGPLKAQSENEAEKQFPGKTTIIRPGLIVGPGDPSDRFTYWPVRIARGGDVLAPGDGNDPVQFIDARDLAEWTIRMAERRVAGIFNATGPDFRLTMEAMLHGIRVSGNTATRFVWAPLDFLEANKVAPWSAMPVWIPQKRDPAFATRSIAAALSNGLTFRPLATTAADTLAWFRTLATDRQGSLESGLAPAREADLLARLKGYSPKA